MKAKWVNIVDSLQGNVDQRHYARRIPGNGEYGAVCAKPELSKKTKKAKAEHPTTKAFAELMAETSATTTRRITSSSNPSHTPLASLQREADEVVVAKNATVKEYSTVYNDESCWKN